MALVSGVSRRFISVVRPCGSSLKVSEIEVKPRTSLNRMVMSRVFAAEHELVGRLRKLLDQGGREILAEGGADAPAVGLLAEIVDEDERQIDREGSRSAERSDRTAIPAARRRYQDTCDQQARRPRCRARASVIAPTIGASATSAMPTSSAVSELDPGRVIRTATAALRQRVFQHLRMHLDARHRRRRPASP